jgi:formate dehydrogenase major subunit
MYANSTEPRDMGFKNLTWDFDPNPTQAVAGEPQQTEGEPDGLKILREINGYYTDDPTRHIAGFGDLKDDGSTTAASWIYCGVFPAPDQNRAANRKADPPGTRGAQLGWGYSWPANRRIMYNRCSADLQGRPWSERKKWVWWDNGQAKWVGLDVPDFQVTKAPTSRAKPDAIGLDALSGSDPFIMKNDGLGWLFVPNGLVDGPLPTHYEPHESPFGNLLYEQRANPARQRNDRPESPSQPSPSERYPYVFTTYRLTEHHTAGGMSRSLPYLAELQPAFFCEVSPELARERGLEHGGWATIVTARSAVEARVMVTDRMRTIEVQGRRVHQIGLPYHWGSRGITTGDSANDLFHLALDPNVHIQEVKAGACDIRPGRRPRGPKLREFVEGHRGG